MQREMRFKSSTQMHLHHAFILKHEWFEFFDYASAALRLRLLRLSLSTAQRAQCKYKGKAFSP